MILRIREVMTPVSCLLQEQVWVLLEGKRVAAMNVTRHGTCHGLTTKKVVVGGIVHKLRDHRTERQNLFTNLNAWPTQRVVVGHIIHVAGVKILAGVGLDPHLNSARHLTLTLKS